MPSLEAFDDDWLELVDIPMVVRHMKRDIVTDLQSIIQQELNITLEKLKTWARETSVVNIGREGAAIRSDSRLSRPNTVRVVIPEDCEMDEVEKSIAFNSAENSFHSIKELREELKELHHLEQDVEHLFREQSHHLDRLKGEMKELHDIEEHIESDVHQFRATLLKNENLYHNHNSITHSIEGDGKEIDDASGITYDQIIEAVLNGPIETLENFLNQKLDPNLVFNNITVGKTSKGFTHCSLLPLAVVGARLPNVELLLNARADIESTYGFIAGTSKLHWSGSAAFAAIPKEDLSMMMRLLDSKADATAVSSNGANMLWQCCYFGKDAMLKLFLSRDVPIEALSKRAAYQNQPGVTYSPLHISVLMGKEKCTRLLLGANVPINERNERMETPLDTAILASNPEIVTLLVKEGADVRLESHHETNYYASEQSMTDKSVPGQEPYCSNTTTTRDTQLSVLSAKVGVDGIEKIFTKRNPVMVRAMACGLQFQPQQVEEMDPSQILEFLDTDTHSMLAMLQALFVERQISFRSKDASKGLLERKTAILRKKETSRGSNIVYRHPITVSSEYSYSDFVQLVKSAKSPDKLLKEFMNELMPQKIEHGLHFCVGSKRQHAPISVYECLVPGIHEDMRILKAIGEAGMFDDRYLNEHCQAMIAYSWKSARPLAVTQCIVQFLLLLFFVVVAAQINYREAYHPHFQLNLRDYMSIVAVIALPIWLSEGMSEVLELMVHYEFGWIEDYLTDIRNVVDIGRFLADGAILLAFGYYGIDAADSLAFRMFAGGVCMLKWTKLLYCLTAFRYVGLPVLPILFTLEDIGSSMAIMVVYYFGLAHWLTVLNVLEQHLSFTVLHTFFFAIGGEFDKVMPLYMPDEGHSDVESWCLQCLLVLALFMGPIMFMNIFIASMSNSYSRGVKQVEKLYQNRCAGVTFDLSCVRYSLRKMCIRCVRHGHRDSETTHRLWYCRERNDGGEVK